MKVDIYQGKPYDASVKLDGVNVADAVRGVAVIMRAGDLPQVDLDLVVVDVSMELDGSQILIPAATRHLLIELGWTPPQAPYRVDLRKH